MYVIEIITYINRTCGLLIHGKPILRVTTRLNDIHYRGYLFTSPGPPRQEGPAGRSRPLWVDIDPFRHHRSKEMIKILKGKLKIYFRGMSLSNK